MAELYANATDAVHMVKVLAREGVPPGSAVYIMADEADFSHFEPLSRAGYSLYNSFSFPRLARLVAGCGTPEEKQAASGAPPCGGEIAGMPWTKRCGPGKPTMAGGAY